MPQTLGPYTTTSSPAFTVGQAFQVKVPREAIAVQIHNESPLRLYVKFDEAQPTAVDSLNGQYDGLAGPWGHPLIPIQRTAASSVERMLNAIRDFTGSIWLMITDPTGALATTGTISNLAEIHLDVYMPGERLPESWAVPRQQDITSQPRVITVPMSLGNGGVQSGRITTPAGGASVTLYNGFIVSSLAGVAGATISFYIYSIYVTPGYNPPGAGGMDCIIQVDLQNAANVSLGFPWPQNIVQANLGWGAANGVMTFIAWPPTPWPAVVAVGLSNANAHHIAILLKNNGSTNAPGQMDFTIASFLGPSGSGGIVQIPGPIGYPSNPINQTL